MSDPWAWLAVVDDRPGDGGGARTAALRTLDGEPAGHLAVWPRTPERPVPTALRIDRRMVDGEGAADLTWLSLATGPPLPFDDPIVTGALRRRLAIAWPGAMSTLLVDWHTIGGALTAGRRRAAVVDDPFSAAFPRRLLRVEAGLLRRTPAPTGPGVTRYGSGNPWPWDVYAGQTA